MTPSSTQADYQTEQAARKRAKRQQIATKLIVSLAILGTISVQAYTAFLRMVCNSKAIPVFCDVPKDPSLYPFLDYPMYSAIKEEGTTLSDDELIAIFADGTEAELTPEDFGLSLYWFHRRILPAFENKKAAEVAAFVEGYEAAGHRPFVAYRFENNVYVVTKDGVKAAAPESFTSPLPLAASERE